MRESMAVKWVSGPEVGWHGVRGPGSGVRNDRIPSLSPVPCPLSPGRVGGGFREAR
jgi:hypothetical protein